MSKKGPLLVSVVALCFALVLFLSIASSGQLALSSIGYESTSLEQIHRGDSQETANVQELPEKQKLRNFIQEIRDWKPKKGWEHLQKMFAPDLVPADKCRAYSCFDFSKCLGPSLKIYTYRNLRQGSFLSLQTALFSYINASGLETFDPEDACIFIPPYDLTGERDVRIEVLDRSVLTKLRELPFWNNGRNHLILYINDKEPVDEGSYGFLDQSMYLASMQSITNFRLGYDISIPIFDGLTREVTRHYNRSAAVRHPAERKLLVSFKGSIYEKLGPVRRNLLELAKAYAGHPRIQLIFRCKSPWKERGVIDCPQLERDFDSSPDFTNLLADSVFGLCPEGWGHHSYRLFESMMYGSIPVVLSDEYVMPYVPEVDWWECAIHFPERLVRDMIPLLSRMSPEVVRKRQLKCLELFEKYFVDNVRPDNPARANGELNAFHHAFTFLARRIVVARR